MRRETFEETGIVDGENGINGYTDFTPLEQALIKTGHVLLVLRADENIKMWRRKKESMYTIDPMVGGWRIVVLKSYKYVKQVIPVHEYYEPFGTRSTFYPYKGWLIPATEYAKIPAEDGGPR